MRRQRNVREGDLPGKGFVLPGIRLLAQAVKIMLLALPMLFFAVAAKAVCYGMLEEDFGLWAPKINAVASVKVNGLEWFEFTTQQWRKAFGEKGVVTEVSHEDMKYMEYIENEVNCTPRHVITVSYPDKIIRLTLLKPFDIEKEKEAEFKALKFDQNFVKQEDNWEAVLDIDWKRNSFKDSLVVGEHAIRADLSFDEFKELFPFSAQQSLAALLSLTYLGEKHERRNETQTYIVEVGYLATGCLKHTVEFTFSNGKLSTLALHRYGPWCSC